MLAKRHLDRVQQLDDRLFGGWLSFIIAALGLTAWPSTARLFRAQVLTLKSRDFVAASRAAGERDFGILTRHVWPLALPVLAAHLFHQAGGAILAEAGLSFLGLGELASSLEQGKGMRPLILRLAPVNEPKPSDEAIEQQSRAIIGRNDPIALAFVQRSNHDQTVTVAQLRSLKMPLLASVGSADPIKAGVDAFKAVLPRLNPVIIDGATHSGARGAPGRPEFAAAVHAFIAAHRTTTTAR